MLSIFLAGLLVLNSSSPHDACNNSGVSFWWEAQSATLGAGDYTSCVSSCNGTATNVTFADDGAKLGTYGMFGSGTAGIAKNTAFTITNDDIVNDCSGAVGFWFKYDGTDPDDAGPLVSAWPSTAGARLWRIESSDGDRIDIRTLGAGGSSEGLLTLAYRGVNGTGSTGAVDTGDISLPERALYPDIWYFIVAAWKCDNPGATDYLKLYVYNSALLLKTSVTSTALNFTWGTDATGTTYTMYVGDDPSTALNQRWQGNFAIDQLVISSNPERDMTLCSGTENYQVGGAR